MVRSRPKAEDNLRNQRGLGEVLRAAYGLLGEVVETTRTPRSQPKRVMGVCIELRRVPERLKAVERAIGKRPRRVRVRAGRHGDSEAGKGAKARELEEEELAQKQREVSRRVKELLRATRYVSGCEMSSGGSPSRGRRSMGVTRLVVEARRRPRRGGQGLIVSLLQAGRVAKPR